MSYKIPVTLAFSALLLTGCGGSDSDPVAPIPVAVDFTLISSSYEEGKDIPLIHACDNASDGGEIAGSDKSPQYSWANSPDGTTSYALIIDDESMPQFTGDDAFRHWAVFNIPDTMTSLAEDVEVADIDNAITEGGNLAGGSTYYGMCPPDTHTYKATVYALGTGMAVVSSGEALTRSQFSTNYADWILDSATITGTFTP